MTPSRCGGKPSPSPKKSIAGSGPRWRPQWPSAMRSSSTAKKFPAEIQAVLTLQAIEKFIIPLAPPVLALGRSIRATPFKTLISVLLSSRTQDAVTAKAASRLFAAAATPRKMLLLKQVQVERLIYPVGFFHTKAKNILKICAILERGGKFPASADELLDLPGIGRKSANLVLALAFSEAAIAVDTHVFRIAPPPAGPRPHARRRGKGIDRTVPPAFGRGSTRRWWDSARTICRPIHPKCRSACSSSRLPIGGDQVGSTFDVRRSRRRILLKG